MTRRASNVMMREHRSSDHRIGRTLRLSVACASALACLALCGCKSKQSGISPRAESSSAATEGRFTPLETVALVLPGRPLLLSLAWSGDSSDAPTTFDARTDAGRTIALPVRRLIVRRIEGDPTRAARFARWRWAAEPFEWVEAGESAGGSDESVLHFLVLENPASWPGSGLHVGTTRVSLIPIEPDAEEPPCAPLPAGWGFDAPESSAPIDAVRRTLWRRHVNPDAPAAPDADNALPALLARQTAGRWCAALRDLRLIDPALGLEIERLLIRTAWDGPTRFAAWPAAPEQLAELEATLLARAIDRPGDEPWAMRLRSWAARQVESAAWIEQDAGGEVHLALANLAAQRQEARLNFTDRPREVTRLDLAPRSISRRVLDRPPQSPSQRLAVAVGDEVHALPLLDAQVVVLPPGRTFSIPWRHWTLDAWLAGRPQPIDDGRATIIRVQRSPERGHWEIIVTCALDRAFERAVAGEGGADPLRDLAHWRELAGHESITLLLGPHEHPIVAATIRPDGSMRDWARSNLLRDEDVRVAQREGRWTAIVALPEALVSEGVLEIGALRMHEGEDAVDCFPWPALPWRCDPGRLRLDLSRWEALPRPPSEPPASAPGAGE